ncbi:hypothetical protein ACFP7A_11055 [Sporolactobacillus kofuensis]|uniref:Uncharacterized protein n=1 Tax=Sporolactobacillus kofuensis TaxID=269672 RepID=A0ABW1WG20_9BACL|nr:hypothetical protein [Sporolactobacillus kofuensis]MCO7176500.1 hypothetical protein [Sporolactobacillus kofuensis]
MKNIFPISNKFIYDLAAKRIYLRKMDLKLTYYNIAGYENKIDYETAEKRTGYDYKLINKIATGNFKGRNNRYLLTETYTDLLVDKLKFSKHEMLWGNDDEIRMYSVELFECLIRDCINEDVNFTDNIFSLLSNFGKESSEVTPEKIDRLLKMHYDNQYTVRDQFIRLFADFTHNKYYSENYVENGGVLESIKEIKPVTIFNDNAYLTFKKLPESIDRFVQTEFSSLLMNIFLKQNRNDQVCKMKNLKLKL